MENPPPIDNNINRISFISEAELRRDKVIAKFRARIPILMASVERMRLITLEMNPVDMRRYLADVVKYEKELAIYAKHVEEYRKALFVAANTN